MCENYFFRFEGEPTWGQDDFALAMEFEKIRWSHNVSKRAANEFWKFIIRHAKEFEGFKQLPNYRLQAEKQLPRMYTSAKVVNNETQQETLHNQVQVLPAEKEDESLCWTKTYIPLREVLQFHNKAHRRHCNEEVVIFGTDGVQQSKSSTATLDVYTVEFPSCRRVYPIGVIKVFPESAKTKESARKNVAISKQLNLDLINEFAEDLRRTGIRVQYAKADAPKRAFLKNTSGHTSYYGCEYCKEKAKLFTSKRSNRQDARTVRKIVWPGREAGAPRTHEEMLMLANANGAPSEQFGVKGESVLAQFEEFNLIDDVPVESMHFIALGVIRSLVSLALGAGPKKSLHKAAKLNEKFLNKSVSAVKLPSEFCRRARPIDVPNWKASEYR